MILEITERQRQLLVLSLEWTVENGSDLIKECTKSDDKKELEDNLEEYKELQEIVGIL